MKITGGGRGRGLWLGFEGGAGPNILLDYLGGIREQIHKKNRFPTIFSIKMNFSSVLY